MSTTFPISRVETVVKQGWRRRLLVLAVDQSALVLALLLGGLSLLLILGTQILAWQWLLALGAVGVTVAVFGVRRRWADTYQVAQMMDRHLSLNDWLSTAWFLQANQVDWEPAAEYQLRRAEEVARNADPAQAFPFERRRSWVLVAALFILALGLFSARYLVTQELSLRRAFLPSGLLQVFENLRHNGGPDQQNQRDAANQRDKSLPPGLLGQDSDRAGRPPKTDEGQKANSQAQSGASNGKGDPATGQNTEQEKSGDGQQGEQKGNSSQSSSPEGSKSSTAKQDANGGDKQGSKQDDTTGPQHSGSLMDRMRDAVSSVMAKIKPTGSPQNSQSSAQKNGEGSKNPDQPGNKDQNDAGQKDAGKEQSAQEQSAGEQPGQGTAKAQASQGQDSAQASDKKGSDAQSGVGHSDGDKDVKAAEQAKAMGKLAEIIGKRSASLTGEMQIEPSGKQRLQTGYTRQQGQHSDVGGEINRDEVPVEDQEYVREYMEMVRKKPAHQAH